MMKRGKKTARCVVSGRHKAWFGMAKRCRRLVIGVPAMIALGSPVSAAAGLTDFLDRFTGRGDAGAADATASLSQSDALAGLKAALRQGAEHAVDSLGRTDGFLGDPEVRIPMPERLTLVEKALRRTGQDDLADTFVEAMNRAAEEAVPAAAEVFTAAIAEMSVDDAVALIDGGPTAGTDYLRRVSSDDLVRRFEPIVARSMDRVGVTRAYQALLGESGRVGRFLGDSTNLDLTAYVTGQAMEGVFHTMAAEEQRIRDNPMARGSELLRRVFGN